MSKRQRKTKQIKNKQKNPYFDAVISIMKFPFRYPLLFFILLLLLTATLVLINRRMTFSKYKRHTTIRNSHDIIIERIQEKCQSKPFAASNKVPGVRLNIINNEFYPDICAEDMKKRGDFSEDCKALISYRNRFMSSPEREKVRKQVINARNSADKILFSEIGDTVKEYAAVERMLTSSQQKKFQEYNERITFLRSAQLIQEYAKKSNAGGCGEQVFSDISDILKIGLNNDMIIRIKYITVRRNDGQAHDFIVINGNTSDVSIENNRRKTSAYLKKLKGYICDSWNEGYFEDITKNKNMIYRGSWDSVVVSTVSLDFNYTGLCEPAKQFLDIRLAKMGYKNLHGKPSLTYPDDLSSRSARVR